MFASSRLRSLSALFSLTLFLTLPLHLTAQDTDKAPAKTPAEAPPKPEAAPVVTHHEIRVGSQTLHYTATAGLMPLRNGTGEIEARVFYMAYTLDNPAEKTKRPLLFAFNGGPGSASAWLHLGAIGPRRIPMQPEGYMPAPPYHVEDNPYTWLTKADLVFVDPIGTGYSRAAKAELTKKYIGVKGDAAAVGQFIRCYLDKYERWSSPLFLAGESYGTTRAAALSGYMLDRYGVAFNGVVLMSAVLNFETLEFAPGNDLPYELLLPTYAATAWFHHKLDASLQGDLSATLKKAEQFASGPYLQALDKGDRLSAEERASIVEGLSRFTGLSKEVIEQNDLRVDESHFNKELLRSSHLVSGRLDSRFTGVDVTPNIASNENDPTIAAIRSPYSSAFNQYIRTELGYKSDDEYFLLGGGFSWRDWEWGSAAEGFPNVSNSLRRAIADNPYMRVYIASGYYDLATPYYATEYTIAHLGLRPEERKRISTGYYEAGHMMYLKDSSAKQLQEDVSKFITDSVH